MKAGQVLGWGAAWVAFAAVAALTMVGVNGFPWWPPAPEQLWKNPCLQPEADETVAAGAISLLFATLTVFLLVFGMRPFDPWTATAYGFAFEVLLLSAALLGEIECKGVSTTRTTLIGMCYVAVWWALALLLPAALMKPCREHFFPSAQQ